MPDPLYLGARTKARLGFQQTRARLQGVRFEVAGLTWLQDLGVVPFVIPSFPALQRAVQTASPGQLVGAQDVARAARAHPGEVPASILGELGVRGALEPSILYEGSARPGTLTSMTGWMALPLMVRSRRMRVRRGPDEAAAILGIMIAAPS